MKTYTNKILAASALVGALVLGGCASSGGREARPVEVRAAVVAPLPVREAPPMVMRARESVQVQGVAPARMMELSYQEAVRTCLIAHVKDLVAKCGGGLTEAEVREIRRVATEAGLAGMFHRLPHLELERKFNEVFAALGPALLRVNTSQSISMN